MCADDETVRKNNSKYRQKPRITVLGHQSTALPHLLSAATASSLGKVCDDHYPLPNSDFPEIGEEMGKTRRIMGMMKFPQFPFSGEFS
ncbi:MAG: hypothetical protein VXX91_04055, partial [Planctomycetota bacterium]|nr:hypothetical protein [Planctomycetota bacterium]